MGRIAVILNRMVTAKGGKGGSKIKMRGGGGMGVNSGYRGGAAVAQCPPGAFCASNSMIFFVLAVVIVVLLGIVVLRGTETPRLRSMALQQQQQAPAFRHAGPPIMNIFGGGGDMGGDDGGDGRYQQAPQPLKSWYSGPEFPPRGGLAPIPINIPTRGLPEKFHSVGIMTLPDGQVLPLYGRRTATSTDRWNYYTRTDTYNPVPIPVAYKKRDCMDDTGCEELMDNEQVTTFGTDNSGKVRIYRTDGPKYIPGIF